MAGSAPAAGISPIISFNRTGENKTKCYFHTSLTSQLILSVTHWLRVAFPMAFLPELWRGSQPGPGSRVPVVTGGVAGSRREGWTEEALRRRNRAWQGGCLLPWGASRAPSHHGDPEQVPRRGSSPSGPLRVSTSHHVSAAAAKCLGERSQVRQSGDKSELSLAVLGLCWGLIGGCGSPPAPLPAPRAEAAGFAAQAGLAPRGKLPTCFQHEEGACVCLSSGAVACESGRRRRMC